MSGIFTSEYFFLAVAVITAMAIYVTASKRKKKKRLLKKLRDMWGKVPPVSYSPEELMFIASFFQNRKKAGVVTYHVDDITWNDLEMDKVFARLNGTLTTVGDEYLYRVLREPVVDLGVLEERERLIGLFRQNRAAREKLQMILAKLDKSKGISLSDFFLGNESPEKKGLYYMLLSGFFIFSILLIAIIPQLGFLLTAASAFFNMATYYRTKNRIEGTLQALNYTVSLIRCAKELSSSGIKEIGGYAVDLRKATSRFRGIVFNSFYSLFYKTEDPFLEYIKVVLLGELIAFDKVLKTVYRYRAELQSIYEIVGLIDSCSAIGSYRESLDFYTIPRLHQYTGPESRYLAFTDLYHPLLTNPVPNSLDIRRSILITGSNASGKSTFLKTVITNAIFAQTIHTCLAKEYSSCCFAIYTSMALKDNLVNGESYFIAEIKSLKRILNAINDKMPCLCAIDEVLRGTNTVERIAASSRVLHSLSGTNCLCLAATHDLELTSILEGIFDNFHFREQLTQNDISFDYKVYPGRSNTRNAIKLLKLMGYDQSIVKAAEDMASQFVEKGTWEKPGRDNDHPAGPAE